jgi:hypothetical protein
MFQIYLKIKKSLPRNRISTRAGTSLVEMIIYIALLVLVASVIVQMLVAIGGVYRNIKLTRELEVSGTVAMDSMLREIRNASAVMTGGSALGISPGVLAVTGKDQDLNMYVITFSTESGALKISKNGAASAALTSSSVTVNHLLFTRVTSANSEGVRIELEVSGTSGEASKSEKFYGFTVLRGSY